MKTWTKGIITLSAAVFFITGQVKGQLTVDSTYTPQQLVQSVLLGGGITATNISCNCATGGYGYFNGTASNIGLSAGVLLTCGQAKNAIGPNNYGFVGDGEGILYEDSQLISIEPDAIYDPCILEFDFVPDSSYVEFKYVFGSEEYNEFVDAGYNDAFGFFLTGPGISNPNNNIALLPGTSTITSVNNVNNGNEFDCPATGPCQNCQYFYDNCNGPSVQYDGFTKVLIAKASVTKGATYHIKLAIADAGDDILDAGVFLECGSFRSIPTARSTSNCAPLSVRPFEDADAIGLYPNPAKNTLTISSPQTISGYEIMNVMGRVVMGSNAVKDKSVTANVSMLPAGTYIINVYSAAGVFRRMFFRED